jgi:hypothetical protein
LNLLIIKTRSFELKLTHTNVGLNTNHSAGVYNVYVCICNIIYLVYQHQCSLYYATMIV